MADKDYPKQDEKVHEVPEQPLDNGYSKPGDSRVEVEPKLNTPGADFSHLKDAGADKDGMPLDNTPAGKAMGNSDGRPMTQDEAHEAEDLKGKHHP